MVTRGGRRDGWGLVHECKWREVATTLGTGQTHSLIHEDGGGQRGEPINGLH